MESWKDVRDLAHRFSKPHFPWPIVTEEMKDAVMKQIDKGFSLEARTKIATELEENLKSYMGMKYGVAVNSGTSAILSMLDGIGIQKGDEVIVPTYTFFATASPLMILGAIPIFADCLLDGNIDPEDIKRKITSKTKAVVITHQWGIPCEMDAILEICKEHKLKLLEDCSRAHGAKYKGKKVGTFGLASAFSLQANKILSGGEMND
jgi:dTDP-4-amino-4,6-dideoxygalactose transaminase